MGLLFDLIKIYKEVWKDKLVENRFNKINYRVSQEPFYSFITLQNNSNLLGIRIKLPGLVTSSLLIVSLIVGESKGRS